MSVDIYCETKVKIKNGIDFMYIAIYKVFCLKVLQHIVSDISIIDVL